MTRSLPSILAVFALMLPNAASAAPQSTGLPGLYLIYGAQMTGLGLIRQGNLSAGCSALADAAFFARRLGEPHSAVIKAQDQFCRSTEL